MSNLIPILSTQTAAIPTTIFQPSRPRDLTQSSRVNSLTAQNADFKQPRSVTRSKSAWRGSSRKEVLLSNSSSVYRKTKSLLICPPLVAGVAQTGSISQGAEWALYQDCHASPRAALKRGGRSDVAVDLDIGE